MNDEHIPHDVFTSRDLNHLSDLFQQNYDAYKQAYFSMNYIQNPTVLKVYQEAVQLFDDELKIAIRILRNPGGEIDE